MRLVVTKMNLGLWAAAYVKEKIHAFRPTAEKPFVMGLPTGGTVVDFYANLRLFYKEHLLDFRHIVTFNMDEYVGLPQDHPQSYHSYMRQNLFSEVNIPPENTHILDGQAANLPLECAQYERAIRQAGGIHLFLGGVGRNGHIAFNEPGSSFDSRTRPVNLTAATIQANSRFFLNDVHRVPTQALTVGIGTILQAQELLFLASGPSKAGAVAQLCKPGLSEACPLTALKLHPHATLLADSAACALAEGPTRQQLDALMHSQPDAPHWVVELPKEAL